MGSLLLCLLPMVSSWTRGTGGHAQEIASTVIAVTHNFLFLRHTVYHGFVWSQIVAGVDHTFKTVVGHATLLNSLDQTVIEAESSSDRGFIEILLLLWMLLINSVVLIQCKIGTA